MWIKELVKQLVEARYAEIFRFTVVIRRAFWAPPGPQFWLCHYEFIFSSTEWSCKVDFQLSNINY